MIIECKAEWFHPEKLPKTDEINIGPYRGFVHCVGSWEKPKGFSAALWYYDIELMRVQFNIESGVERFGVRSLIEYWLTTHHRIKTESFGKTLTSRQEFANED